MHSMLQYPFDAGKILARRKRIKRELLEGKGLFVEKRIAILGGSTTHDVTEIMELFLLDNGIKPVFYESDYGQYWQDAMFGNERLRDFHPDLVYVHTCIRNIETFPSIADTEEEVESLTRVQFERFSTMWEKLSSVYGCPIIQNNFELPYVRLLGNREAHDIHGTVRFVREMNRRFADYASLHEDFHICDLEYLSSCYGLDAWSDPQYWYLYKYALSFPAIPVLAHNVASIVKAIFGKNKKGLVCDLDNTLWGGVIGDDGVEGIAIGQETAEGEAYRRFQAYLKSLTSIGAILCVDSKNELENALAGLSHPDNVLSAQDFVSIKANWESKDFNFLQIAHEVNLLPESLVFLDDNPAERAIVTARIPGVIAPELEKVEDYLRILDRSGFFEAVSISEDDAKRNEMYRANRDRAVLETSFANYDEYLRSLLMSAEIAPFDDMRIPRITQLANKTNQFNLTTRRYTQGEIEIRAHEPEYLTLFGRLEDRFGDNGVVSAIIGKIVGSVLHIELWIMSCRVFRRGLEDAMLDVLVDSASQSGLHSIRGYYRRTPKNGLVSTLYETMGFSLVGSTDEASEWELDLEGYENRNRVITVNGRGV